MRIVLVITGIVVNAMRLALDHDVVGKARRRIRRWRNPPPPARTLSSVGSTRKPAAPLYPDATAAGAYAEKVLERYQRQGVNIRRPPRTTDDGHS
jgi:hypothetical protein